MPRNEDTIEPASAIRPEKREAKTPEKPDNVDPFAVAVRTTRMPMVFTDAKSSGHSIVFTNDSFLRLTGYSSNEVLGRKLDDVMNADLGPRDRDILKAAIEGDSGSKPEMRYRRKDGSAFWATLFSTPVRDNEGEVIQQFISFIDTTETRLQHDRLQFLLDELNHRTQNTLATVQAIALQTLRAATDKDAIDTFVGRLLALSKAHALLGSQKWDLIGLHEIVDRILEPFGVRDKSNPRITVTGNEIRFQAKPALALAMMFNELATNASKYGALSGDRGGSVEIVWTVSPDHRVHLLWREHGGPPVAPPRHSGFGLRLIRRGLAQELGADIDLQFNPTGLIFQIAMPIPDSGRPPDA